ncbi:hypothetical protein [Mycobacterium sp. 852002-51057_SCH5723018]|uniref:hypothetical protein n=1 Tax=Mycobacterium sp. 852002-51057_SCH5723018 TaxID=1834094 RepID=UPI0007FBF454|nr:hypothetical protein [Mycobacterium sp. 852002-51057_SCH5723018]OBG29617.1 hypothetical protein A5764_21780 [Mycobacterium sp. 852002-51057_SCH5723018]
MSATQDQTRTAIEIDDDVELINEQIKALKELGRQDDQAPISEGQRYDFSIRWGTVLAGRLRRLVHYSSLGELDDAGERTFHAVCDELRGLSHLIDRFRLAQPRFSESPPARARRFRRG